MILDVEVEKVLSGSEFSHEFYGQYVFTGLTRVQFTVYTKQNNEYAITLTFSLSESGCTLDVGSNEHSKYHEDVSDIFLQNRWRPEDEDLRLLRKDLPLPTGMRFQSKLLKRADAEDQARVRLVDNLVHGYSSEDEEDQANAAISYFPFQGGSLFRGYAFVREEEYDAFMKKTYQGNTIKGGGVWFKNRDDAARNAIKRSKNEWGGPEEDNQDEDWQTGFRGAIVEIIVDDNRSGVDLDLVNASRSEEEKSNSKWLARNQVWLKTDLYELRTERRAGGESVTKENADQVLIKMVKKPDCNLQDVLFVVHNIKSLSEKARAQAFKFLYSKLEFDISYESGRNWGGFQDELRVYTNIGEKEWNLFKYFDVWLPKDQERLLREMRTAIRQGDRQIRDLIYEHDLDLSKIHLDVNYIARWMFHMAGEGMTSLQRSIGGRYQSLGDEGRAINQLSGEEQRRAIDDHTKRIVSLLENLCRLTPEDPKKK